jgi:hypothetical protein
MCTLAINEQHKRKQILNATQNRVHRCTYRRTAARHAAPVSLAVVPNPKGQRPGARSTRPLPLRSHPILSQQEAATARTTRARASLTRFSSHHTTTIRPLSPLSSPNNGVASRAWAPTTTTTTTRWIRVFNPSLLSIANCNCAISPLSLFTLLVVCHCAASLYLLSLSPHRRPE